MRPPAPLLTGQRRLRTLVALLVLACSPVVIVGLAAGGPAAAADEPSSTTVVSTDTTASPVGEAGIGDLEGGSNTPSPRGEPAPPRSQRVADSAIAVVLLVVLAGGVIVAIWTARRRPRRGSTGAVGGPQRER